MEFWGSARSGGGEVWVYPKACAIRNINFSMAAEKVCYEISLIEPFDSNDLSGNSYFRP